MRIRIVGILGIATVALSACGSTGGKSPHLDRPPSPINLTVSVNDAKVSVSPRAVGAGPVNFIVTNQASQSESLSISRSGQSHPIIASTAPINPQGTTQVSVNFRPGDYTIATASRGSTDASLSAPSSIRAASVHIGRERPSANNDVLQP
jgi:hypothetical protein